ncbi:MAG: hypothetical protein SPJ68_07255 [Arcanobacterium sp.]|nr:hypothetical protein [Arcanobacterium sp.]
MRAFYGWCLGVEARPDTTHILMQTGCTARGELAFTAAKAGIIRDEDTEN